MKGADIINSHAAKIDVSPEFLFGRHNAGRERRRNPTEPALSLHAFQQAVSHRVGCGIEKMCADPGNQAVLPCVMAKRKVFVKVRMSHVAVCAPAFTRIYL